MSSGRPTKIMHISDLHFGSNFNQTLWTDLVRVAADQRPQIIVATGDFVNNPFRWTLRKAREELASLASGSSTPDSAPNTPLLITVPGNHDTRLWGLFPLIWLTSVAATAAFLAIFLWWRGSPVTYWLTSAAVALVSVSIRLCCQSFHKAFADTFRTTPVERSDLGLVIYPFDSARPTLRWARGIVPMTQFVKARAAKISPDLFPIALLHHHPMPIPNEDKHEHMLVLNNAGRVLAELSSLGVRLVLHGHKHHRSYARCVVSGEKDHDFGFGVLAAGSATAGNRPGVSGHSFYMLELGAGRRITVTPYVSDGGLFQGKDPFSVEAQDLRETREYTRLVQQIGREYDAVISIRRISEDGDVVNRTEYRGFKVLRPGDSVSELPKPFVADVGGPTGHIELLDAGALGDRPPVGFNLRIDTDPSRYTLRHQEALVNFGRDLTSDALPISFYCSFHGLNTYAMSEEQFREMYANSEPPVEWARNTVKVIPARELIMIVLLPGNFRIDGIPELFISDPRETSRLASLGKAGIYDNVANVILFRIPYPLLEVDYTIRWKLISERPRWEKSDDRLLAEVRSVRKRLLDSSTLAPVTHVFDIVAMLVVTSGRLDLGLTPDDVLEVSLFVYDQAGHVLKLVAANFDHEQGDSKSPAALKYGDGIAGRAYKLNRARHFVKERAIRERGRLYYYPADGRPISADQIREEAILCLPLSHPRNPEMIYGVLSIASCQPTSQLIELHEEDPGVKLFLGRINAACFRALGELQSTSG